MLIHMPKQMLTELESEAARRGCSMSQIVREGLAATLPSHDPAYPGTAEAAISLYLPHDTEDALRTVAERTQTRIADLVRSAIEHELSATARAA